MLRGLKITLISLILASTCSAQVYTSEGLKVGLVYEYGQVVHRLGLSLGFYLNRGAIQFSSNTTCFYAFKNYGPNRARLECQAGAYIGIGFGSAKINSENIALHSGLSNYSNKNNLAVYGIKYYWDQIDTKQLTGAVSLRLGNYFIATENDGFVFLPFDKYRTGAISVGRYFFNANRPEEAFSAQRISLDILIYTGQTQGPHTERLIDSQYPARFGYKKLNDAKYHASSHGILKLNWTSSIQFDQNVFVDLGIDNERIRNLIQNKVIHDLPFLPNTLLKKRNPHVPMRNTKGKDYLYRKNEKIRKGEFIWGAGLNRPLFY